ncbi:MAG TPA: hypothetical protein VFI46_05840 [Jiangellaceae bacterium]|nr:hypothetical protein [Jiangellaceae bacterium]
MIFYVTGSYDARQAGKDVTDGARRRGLTPAAFGHPVPADLCGTTSRQRERAAGNRGGAPRFR